MLSSHCLMGDSAMQRERVLVPVVELSQTRQHRYYWVPAQSLGLEFVCPASGERDLLAFVVKV